MIKKKVVPLHKNGWLIDIVQIEGATMWACVKFIDLVKDLAYGLRERLSLIGSIWRRNIKNTKTSLKRVMILQ